MEFTLEWCIDVMGERDIHLGYWELEVTVDRDDYSVTRICVDGVDLLTSAHPETRALGQWLKPVLEGDRDLMGRVDEIYYDDVSNIRADLAGPLHHY